MQTRTFALWAGIIYAIIGVLGFLPGLRTLPSHALHVNVEQSYGYLFGLFPINVVHNIVHLALGIWGIFASRHILNARRFSRILAVLYAILAVMGVLPYLNVVGGLIPLYGHDVWLHAVTALIAGYFGFVHHDTMSETYSS